MIIVSQSFICVKDINLNTSHPILREENFSIGSPPLQPLVTVGGDGGGVREIRGTGPRLHISWSLSRAEPLEAPERERVPMYNYAISIS